ncbi:TonB-dependent siderophore receptor [Biostraticola tofi]|uniref:Ferric enterobactin receptor n=1 Tax=Biostraticola tofi TaxID=466109 RepID=A0A4V2W568_9GAMM|nr:TonB-dependent siderophore receptor [Biostraticola tofi]TCV98329.1 ferric enterobactin receptor [Biostraticola tofi]
MYGSTIIKVKSPLAVILMGLLSHNVYATPEDEAVHEEELIVQASAEEALKQQPGVSIITADDIKKSPPVNDLSDIIRKMPGVNLTGNSATGSRGNNRQIDIRGMGPENTLILVDGHPVRSRDAVRYSWRGERDTRGDSNWVPAEMVERIEVIRGPAASRYGSGAAGGVINIITKRPTNRWSGSLSIYGNQPEDSQEGATRRANFSLSGPLVDDTLTLRLYGNLNKTDGDSWDLNTQQNGSQAAGREGVRNRDINSVVSWKMTPNQIIDFEAGYSRQGNIYAGDTQYSSSSAATENLAKSAAETNRLYRQNYGVTHNGLWDWGQSKTGFYYEKTNNTRLKEGMAGSGEGRIQNDLAYSTSRLRNYSMTGELTVPFNLLWEQTATLGAEWNREQLNDPSATSYHASENSIGSVSGDPAHRSSKNSAELSAIYLEDNIEVTPGSKLIPGLRFDYHSRFGSNYSPSLNYSQQLSDQLTVKAGIGRVFKAPNLYQSSQGYLMTSRGNGCPITMGKEGCYLMGNSDLEPEISINKEIGLEFTHNGYHAGITYFRNDYKNKVVSGTEVISTTSKGTKVLRWENGGKALVEGLEANLLVPLVEDKLSWNTNATYMMTSKLKDTGNPLSIIPEYTVNTLLDWQVNDKLSTHISWTLYGKQKPRTTPEIYAERKGLSESEIGSYSVAGIGVNYEITEHVRLNAGISNLLDKRIYRRNDGASTYNEPGRAYYAGVTTSF